MGLHKKHVKSEALSGVGHDRVMTRIMPSDLRAYIKTKLKLLKDFKVALTDDQIEHIWSLDSEVEIDRFAHDLIMKRLGNDKD